MDVSSVIERVLAGDRRGVARAISMVEDGAEGLAELSAGLYPHTGDAYTIGLTGYYTMIAMVLNTARTPLPAGAAPGLPAFPR